MRSGYNGRRRPGRDNSQRCEDRCASSSGSIPVAHHNDSPFASRCCGDDALVFALRRIVRSRIEPSGAVKIEEREVLLVVRDHVRVYPERESWVGVPELVSNPPHRFP